MGELQLSTPVSRVSNLGLFGIYRIAELGLLTVMSATHVPEPLVMGLRILDYMVRA